MKAKPMQGSRPDVRNYKEQSKITKIQPFWIVLTVHKDVSERLQKINPCLALEVRKILDENKAERHIRGGMATKLKYSNEKEQHVG